MALELNVQGLAAVGALAEARRLEKAAKAAAEAAAEKVLEYLDGETVGTLAGVTVVEVKHVERHDVDGKRLKAELPEVREAYDKLVEYDKIVLA